MIGSLVADDRSYRTARDRLQHLGLQGSGSAKAPSRQVQAIRVATPTGDHVAQGGPEASEEELARVQQAVRRGGRGRGEQRLGRPFGPPKATHRRVERLAIEASQGARCRKEEGWRGSGGGGQGGRRGFGDGRGGGRGHLGRVGRGRRLIGSSVMNTSELSEGYIITISLQSCLASVAIHAGDPYAKTAS